jgi:hypothetical protein
VPGAGVAALLVIGIATAGAGERRADPTQAFVEGHDPSAKSARMRRSNDGVDDLALSDSSTWGNAGGQWLLFRGQPDQSHVYWGTLFFSPGTAVLRPQAPGTAEMALYVRLSVSRGTVQVYRMTSAAISPISECSLDLERSSDRERYEALLRSGRRVPVEYCKLLEYRRAAATCWQPGLGLR